jgi:hypothetical protein
LALSHPPNPPSWANLDLQSSDHRVLNNVFSEMGVAKLKHGNTQQVGSLDFDLRGKA